MSAVYHDAFDQGSEQWRPVAGFPDYEASSLGNIRRCKADLRNHRVSGKPLKAALSKSGYLHVTLCRDAKSYNRRVNRVVCEAFHGAPDNEFQHAAHSDGDSTNNRADNLRWVDGVENEADKRKHGTARIGERHWSKSMPERRAKGLGHGRAKLTPDCVRSIRADSRGQRIIAADYGVSQRVIWMVKARKTWGHVE